MVWRPADIVEEEPDDGETVGLVGRVRQVIVDLVVVHQVELGGEPGKENMMDEEERELTMIWEFKLTVMIFLLRTT